MSKNIGFNDKILNMAWYYILLIVLGVILFLFLAFTLSLVIYLANFSFNRNFKYKSSGACVCYDEEFLNNPINTKVTLKSYDNLSLVGYFFRHSDSHKYVILVHGYRGKYYEQSHLAHDLYDKGLNTLLVVNRSHGESEGKYIGVGSEDKKDLIKWIEYIIDLDKDAEIALFGWSMGGATVLLSTKYLNKYKNVKVVVADCGYTSFYDQVYYLSMTRVFKNNKFLSKIITNLLYVYAKVFYKIDIKDSTLNALKENKLPILLIHGEIDDFVPIEFSYKNFDAITSKKEFKIFKTNEHCCSLRDNEEEYTKLVYDFINENLK